MRDQSVKVLVIEDNPEDFRLLVEALLVTGGEDFDMESVDRLSTGLKQMTEGGVDVILLDLNLPDSMGIETVKKAIAHDPRMPIIVLSGLADVETAVQALREGAQDYLIKGETDGRLLTRSIRYAVERKEAEKAIKTIVTSIVGSRGTEVFNDIVGSLAEWLNIDCVILGELVDENRVQALAMMLDGKNIDGYSYDLPASPCETVAEKGFCIYPDGVSKLFPDDRDLVEMGAEGYAGVLLKDKNGDSLGILCAISRRKLQPPPGIREVFEIIAVKAAAAIENKRIEEELREISNQLRINISRMPVGYMVWDNEFKMKEWNLAAEAIFGYSKDEILGKSLLETIVPEEARNPVAEVMHQLLAGKDKVHYSEDGNNIRKDGTVISCLWFNTPLKDASDNTIGVLSMAMDVTKRKQAEAELKQYQEHLEELVQERTKELEEKNKDLREYNKLFVDREFRIKELRDRVEELEK